MIEGSDFEGLDSSEYQKVELLRRMTSQAVLAQAIDPQIILEVEHFNALKAVKKQFPWLDDDTIQWDTEWNVNYKITTYYIEVKKA